MKLSLAISAAFVGLFLLTGWSKHTRITSMRATHTKLTAEATRLGISSDSNTPALTSKSRRERQAPNPAEKATAADLIAAARELISLQTRKTGPSTHAAEILQRTLDFMDRLAVMDTDELELLISEFRSNPDLDYEKCRGLITSAVIALAKDHPQAALDLIIGSSDSLAPHYSDQNLISSTLGEWAKDNPAAALDWFLTHAEKFPELLGDQAKYSLIRATADRDPGLALKLIDPLKLNPSQVFSSIVDNTTTPAARTAALAAFRDYLPKVSDPAQAEQLQTIALVSMARYLVQDGFASGSAWIASVKPSQEEFELVAQGIGSSFSTSETGQWLDLISTTLPPEKAADSIRSTLGQWAWKDYPAVDRWLESVPEGTIKLIATQTYVKTLGPSQPETAAKWAVTLPPGQDRDRSLQAIYQNWQQKDPTAAATFARQQGLK